MIKATEYNRAVPQGPAEAARVDALAQALGFEYKDGAYISTKAAKTKGVRTARFAKARKVVKQPHGHHLPIEFYNRIGQLPVGARQNINDVMQEYKITLHSMTVRISQWASVRRVKKGIPGNFSVYRTNNDYFVERTA